MRDIRFIKHIQTSKRCGWVHGVLYSFCPRVKANKSGYFIFSLSAMIRGDRIGGKVSQGGGGPNENNFMSGSKNPFWSNVFFLPK